MVDDEFLKNLHHVLLEVRPDADPCALLAAHASTDAHRGGRDGLPELQPHLPHLERHSKHGARCLSEPSSRRRTYVVAFVFLLQLLAEHEIA